MEHNSRMTIAQPNEEGVEALIQFYMSLFVQAQVSGLYLVTCRSAIPGHQRKKTSTKSSIFAVQCDVRALASEGVLPTDREEVRWMCGVDLFDWSYDASEEEV